MESDGLKDRLGLKIPLIITGTFDHIVSRKKWNNAI